MQAGQRLSAADEACEAWHAAAAGDHTERRLRLTENPQLSRGKAHIARQNELIAGAVEQARYTPWMRRVALRGSAGWGDGACIS